MTGQQVHRLVNRAENLGFHSIHRASSSSLEHYPPKLNHARTNASSGSQTIEHEISPDIIIALRAPVLFVG